MPLVTSDRMGFARDLDVEFLAAGREHPGILLPIWSSAASTSRSGIGEAAHGEPLQAEDHDAVLRPAASRFRATKTDVESRKEKIGPSSARESGGKVHQPAGDRGSAAESAVTLKAERVVERRRADLGEHAGWRNPRCRRCRVSRVRAMKTAVGGARRRAPHRRW